MMISLKNFDFIQVKPNDENLVDVLVFCGVTQEKLNVEVNFHQGGDTFKFAQFDLNDLVGKYILKFENGTFEIIDSTVFEKMFSFGGNKNSANVERMSETLNLVLESGQIRDHKLEQKVLWALGCDVENEQEIASLKPNYS